MEAVFQVDPILRPVIPYGVAVGRHKQFRCCTDPTLPTISNEDLAANIYHYCGLESWGWDLGRMTINLIARTHDGKIYRVERI